MFLLLPLKDQSGEAYSNTTRQKVLQPPVVYGSLWDRVDCYSRITRIGVLGWRRVRAMGIGHRLTEIRYLMIQSLTYILTCVLWQLLGQVFKANDKVEKDTLRLRLKFWSKWWYTPASYITFIPFMSNCAQLIRSDDKRVQQSYLFLGLANSRKECQFVIDNKTGDLDAKDEEWYMKATYHICMISEEEKGSCS